MPMQYSAAQPQNLQQPGTTIVDLGTLPGVNFSGQTIGTTASAFTVGGWIRLRYSTSQVNEIIFSASGQFELQMDPDGYLIADFMSATSNIKSSTTSSIKSDVPILVDLAWHYVAASFCQSPGSTSTDTGGEATVFIDGLPVAAGRISSTAPLSAGDCTLAGWVQYASWAVWSRTINVSTLEIPRLGVPLKGSELVQDLVGAWDFAYGTVVDRSVNKRTATLAGPLSRFVPCLQGAATAPSQDSLNPSGSSPFTLMAWVWSAAVPNTINNVVSNTE
jgi:hypothetical protein